MIVAIVNTSGENSDQLVGRVQSSSEMIYLGLIYVTFLYPFKGILRGHLHITVFCIKSFTP